MKRLCGLLLFLLIPAICFSFGMYPMQMGGVEAVVPQFGPNLVVNGDFSDTASTDSSSAPLAGWANGYTHNSTNKVTIAGNVATYSCDGTSMSIYQTILEVDVEYRVEVYVTSTVQTLRITNGFPNTNLVQGANSFDLTATGTVFELLRKDPGTTTVVFDDVIIRVKNY